MRKKAVTKRLCAWLLLGALLGTLCACSKQEVSPNSSETTTATTVSPSTGPKEPTVPTTTLDPFATPSDLETYPTEPQYPPFQPTEPAEDARDTLASRSHSSNLYDGVLNLEDQVLYIDQDGLYQFKDGESTLLLNGQWNKYSLSSDGRDVFFIDHQNVVTSLDMETGELRSYFQLQPYDYLVGVHQGMILLGHQDDESDWWGVEVIGYDENGQVLCNYGDGWDASLDDGYLRLESFRSDVSPKRLTIYGPDGVCLLQDVYCWNAEYRDGVYYFVRIDAQELDFETQYPMELCSLSAEGLQVLADLGTTSGSETGYINAGIATTVDDSHGYDWSVLRYYDMNGQQVDENNSLFQQLTANRYLQTSRDGTLFYVLDGQLYVQSGEEFLDRGQLQGQRPFVLTVQDGYVFYHYTTDGVMSDLMIQPLS